MVSAQGPDWQQYRDTVTVEYGSPEEAIRILASTTGGPNGNIAVDDITVKFGACGESDDDGGISV